MTTGATVRPGDEVRIEWTEGAAWVRVSYATVSALAGVTTLGRWVWAWLVWPGNGVRVTDHRPERDEALRLAWVEQLRSVRVRWDGEGRRAA